MTLTATPVHGASVDQAGDGNLLDELLSKVTRSATQVPAMTSPPSGSTASIVSPEQQSSQATSDGAAGDGDVTSAAGCECVGATDDAYVVGQDSEPTKLTPDVNDNDTQTPVGNNTASDPAHGTYDDATGMYTPDPGFHGTDTFTYHFSFVEAGQTLKSNTATVTITVTPSGGCECVGATDDAYVVGQDSEPTKLTPDVNDNDTQTPVGNNTASDPAHGTYDDATGMYTPDPGFHGTDTFTYHFSFVEAGQTLKSNTATVTITVTPSSGGSYRAVDDAYSVVQDSGPTILTPSPLANDSTGGTVAVSVTAQPSNGTVTSGPGGVFTYTPDPGFNGTDTFRYRFTNDLLIDSNEATVTMTVTGSAGELTANNDAYTVEQNSEQNVFTVQSNDSNPAAARLRTPSEPQHGTVTKRDGPNEAYLYTPDPGFHGTDRFTYSFQYLNDENQKSNTATVTITVNPTSGGGGDDLLDVKTNCSGDIWFTNTSDIGLEVVYGDLPSDVDGDFVLAPGDTEEVSTERDELEYRADGPGDETEEGTARFYCSDDDDDDDDGGDDDEEDDDDDDDDKGGNLPDTGGTVTARLLLLAMLSSIGGMFLVARSRRIA